VKFSNVSDTALNVSFYVEEEAAGSQKKTFVGHQTLQVARGKETTYKLSRHQNWNGNRDATVHVCVEPVTPSWTSAAPRYWLELLTHPPVSIVATGSASTLTFNTGTGQIATIPSSEINSGKFEHRIVTVDPANKTNEKSTKTTEARAQAE
jgi:hypothetical protein